MITCATDISLYLFLLLIIWRNGFNKVSFLGAKHKNSEIVNSLSLCILRQVTAQCDVVFQVFSMLNWALLQSAIVGSLKSCPTLKGR